MVRKSSVSSLFAESPVRPLQQHMQKVQECLEQLPPFFEQVMLEDWERVEAHQQRIHALEVEADALKQALRLNLPNNLFMPMPRERILDLLTMQDNIANKAKDIAGIVTGRNMQLPDTLKEHYPVFLARCIDASRQAQTCINELDELVEAGFKGREVSSVEAMIVELHHIEHETDLLEQQLRKALFAIESELPPVDVMFLYRIIEWTGELADLAQKVGSRLQLLLAR